ncbi:Fanconi Anemia Group M Protein [Manis pentadactyla]|nr:Fanconi Anemia Group M Protein [Manis pentadactyla]
MLVLLLKTRGPVHHFTAAAFGIMRLPELACRQEQHWGHKTLSAYPPQAVYQQNTALIPRKHSKFTSVVQEKPFHGWIHTPLRYQQHEVSLDFRQELPPPELPVGAPVATPRC